MFGRDDNEQPAGDAAAQSVPSDGMLAASSPTALDTSSVPAAVSPDDNGLSLPATPAPAPDVVPADTTVAPAPSPAAPAGDLIGNPGDDLLQIKQRALQQLSPLVGHLDQTPEEKFRTTMMMIQASDNQDLIKDAYAAAEQISDEKTRAQALLDIVNEINYFTQSQN